MDYVETTWLRRLDELKHASHVPCGVLYKVIRNRFPKRQTNPRFYFPIISYFHSALPLGLGQKAVHYGITKKAKDRRSHYQLFHEK